VQTISFTIFKKLNLGVFRFGRLLPMGITTHGRWTFSCSELRCWLPNSHNF